MSPNVLRWVLAAGALALHILLFVQQESQPWFWVTRALAPPLTHIAGAGERTLAPPGVQLPPAGRDLMRVLQPAVGGSADRSQAKALRRAAQLSARLTDLEAEALGERLAVQAQALTVMTAMGSQRLGQLELKRAASSAAMGEAWVWADAAQRLGADPQ